MRKLKAALKIAVIMVTLMQTSNSLSAQNPLKSVSAAGAPKAVGPYSHAVVSGGFVFTSGQLGLSPETGDFVSQDVSEQTRQVFRNLDAVLKAAGSSLDKTVKVTVFLKDMADFQAVNAVFKEFLHEPFPARSCVEVARLPKDGKVEIELVAAR